MKAVLDSSVLFSAFLGSSAATRDLFQLARLGRFELCLSESLLAETAQALLRKSARLAYRPEEVIEYVDLLGTVATVIDDPPAIAPVCRDPNDDHVLAAALGAGADFLLTGDGDLLSLEEYRGIRILTVRAFLDLLGH